jgi:hypothetical protein
LVGFARRYAAGNLNGVLYAAVALPAGTSADFWQDDAIPNRTLLGEVRVINGHRCEVHVQPTALQFSDGRIDDGSFHEPPQLYINDTGLTTTQARELAATLIEVADEVDGWVTR